MNFIFRNNTVFWDIPKWNRRQTNWGGMSIFLFFKQIKMINFRDKQ